MEQTRREFMKDVAVTGTVVAVGSTFYSEKSGAIGKENVVEKARCPFFDQPLLCGGPDEFGRYKCDN